MKNKYLIVLVLTISLPILYSFTSIYLESAHEELGNNEHAMVTGEQLFQRNCSACHGFDMTGNPPLFPSLLTVNEKMEKNEVMELLQAGKNKMPSFAHLTEAERMSITGYLFGENTKTEIVTNITPAENGHRLFVANCARCHKATAEEPLPPDQKEWGMPPAILGGITEKHSMADFKNILDAGPCYMPSFEYLDEADKEGIYVWLSTMENLSDTSNFTSECGCRMRCR